MAITPEYNLTYGPWQNSDWLNDFMDGAADVAQHLSANDPLLLRVWPGICKDMGFNAPELQDSVARANFLQSLPTFVSLCFVMKGQKAATSRWMSWQTSFRFNDKVPPQQTLGCSVRFAEEGLDCQC